MDETTVTGLGLGFLLVGILFFPPFIWVGLGIMLVATVL